MAVYNGCSEHLTSGIRGITTMRPSLNVLTKTQIIEILHQAKRILAEIGIDVRGANLRHRLLQHRIRSDAASGRLLFPPEVVDQAIDDAPAAITLYDRAGYAHATLGGDSVHFVPGSSALQILDHRTDDNRPATTFDFVEYVRLADSLEHIAYLSTAFSTNDIEPEISDAWRLFLCLTNSTYPIVSGAFTAQGVPRMAEMLLLFRQDKADLAKHPFSIFTITPSGNFRYGEDSCQNLLDCVEWGIPIEIVPVTNMGLNAPVTLFEAAAFHTADVLAGVVMAQLLHPGHPVLFGGAPAVFHMRESTSPMAAIEAMHLTAAYAAIGNYLDLPTQAYLALGDGKQLDAQAGAETFGGALLAALSGINSVSGPGMLDFVMTFSLTKLVLDNELCGQALHLVRELQPIGHDSITDLVRSLLQDGQLLTSDHTLQHWSGQLYIPGQVYDRQNRHAWQLAGCKTLQDRARSEVDRRLAQYRQVETDLQVKAELVRLIRSGFSYDMALPEVPTATQDSE